MTVVDCGVESAGGETLCVSSTHCHCDRGCQYGWPGGSTWGLELHSALSTGGETGRTSLHINGVELSAVCRMLGSLEEALLGQVIQIESDNTSTVAYINKKGVALRQ